MPDFYIQKDFQLQVYLFGHYASASSRSKIVNVQIVVFFSNTETQFFLRLSVELHP